MTSDQFPQSNKPPTNGDFVPASAQDAPSGMDYAAPEVSGEASALPEASSFGELPNDAKINLYKTDRFNRIVGQKVMPLLEAYIDSPDSDISREAFGRDFSGDLSPRGFLLDRDGNETIHRPDSLTRFRVDPIDENEAIESAYKQFTDEQKLGQAIDGAEVQDAALTGNIGHAAVCSKVLTAVEVIAQYGEGWADGYDPFPMKETDPEVIDMQIKVGLEVTRGNVFNFVNNIETLMPNDFKRAVVEDRDKWDEPVKKPREGREIDEGTSDRIQNVTWREYFADVDTAIVAAGLNLDEYLKLHAVRINPPEGDQGEAQEALVTYLLPMYRQLRMMGYSHHDLRS